jgi:hypothetical protein
MSIYSGSESAIWARVIHPERGDLPPEVARFFLDLAFEQNDIDRIHELLVKNQAGELSAAESEELRDYLQVGLEIDLLRSKARLAIRNGPSS